MNRQSLGAWSYKSDPRDYKRVIRAKKGKLVNPEDKSKFSLELEDGYMIQEWDPKSFKESNIPFTKYNFKQTTISFEMNAFEFQRSSEKSYQKEEMENMVVRNYTVEVKNDSSPYIDMKAS